MAKVNWLFLSLALYCLQSLAAVNAASTFDDVTALLERANTLVNWAQQLKAKHEGTSHGHLFNAMQAEQTDLYIVVNAFRQLDLANANATIERVQIADLEERLLLHTNRLSEEIKFLEDVFAAHSTTKQPNQLITYGEVLVKRAHEVTERYKTQAKLADQLEQLRLQVNELDILLGQMKHSTEMKPIVREINENRLVAFDRNIREMIRLIQLNH